MSRLPVACRWLTGTIIASLYLGTSSPVRAVEHLQIEGHPPKRWIEGDELGYFYDIPTHGNLDLKVQGPGTLVMFLVNHETHEARGATTLVVAKDQKAWKHHKLGCVSTRQRFVGGGNIRPCKRITRDLRVPSGMHRLSLRLRRTRVGASVHFLYAGQPEIDQEPEIVTSTITDANNGSEWQEASEVDLDPIAAAPAVIVPSDRVSSWQSPIAWATVAVGVGAAGTAVYFGLRSQSKFEDAARPDVTQRQRRSWNNDGKRSAVIANSLFGLAGVSLVTAGILFALDGWSTPVDHAADAPSDASGWAVMPLLEGGKWVVDACWQF